MTYFGDCVWINAFVMFFGKFNNEKQKSFKTIAWMFYPLENNGYNFDIF